MISPGPKDGTCYEYADTGLDRVGLAPSYLAELFVDHLGQPPHRYLNERRIERARQLLEGSDLTITALALSLGYGSSHRFARVFRPLTGTTPTAYRLSSDQIAAIAVTPRATPTRVTVRMLIRMPPKMRRYSSTAIIRKQMAASSPETKSELENACKQMMESMKAALQSSYGCSF